MESTIATVKLKVGMSVLGERSYSVFDDGRIVSRGQGELS